jgi:hypothetical protein
MRLKIKVTRGLVQFRTVVDGNPSAALDLPGGDYEYELSGDFEYEEAERYVTVQIVSTRISEGQREAEWTYIDPWGDLQVGDFVRVPFGVTNHTFSGRVVAVDTDAGFLRYNHIKTIKSRARFEDA